MLLWLRAACGIDMYALSESRHKIGLGELGIDRVVAGRRVEPHFQEFKVMRELQHRYNGITHMLLIGLPQICGRVLIDSRVTRCEHIV